MKRSQKNVAQHTQDSCSAKKYETTKIGKVQSGTRNLCICTIPEMKIRKNASADCTETLSYVDNYGGAHSWQIPWRPPTFRFPEQRNRLFRPSCRLEVELWSSIRMLAHLTIIGFADWHAEEKRRGRMRGRPCIPEISIWSLCIELCLVWIDRFKWDEWSACFNHTLIVELLSSRL